MTKNPQLLFAALLSCLLVSPVSAVAPPGGPQTRFTVPHIPAQLLVKPLPGVMSSAITEVLAPYSAVILEFYDTGGLYVVSVDDDTNLAAAVLALEADPRFEFAEPNYLYDALATPNDLDFSRQWSKDNTGVNAPNGLGNPGADMNLVAAWDTRTTTPGVVVAVIDDGVETTHADLVGNILPSGRCFASPGSQRPCANGPNDPNPSDANDFHGTLVSGTFGARGNNGIGIAGVAWETSILPLKVDLSSLAIVSAIDEAIAQDADIINMSFGGPVQGSAQSEALSRAEGAGILAVASSGNADANNDIALHFPSDSNHRNVISVAATTSQDKIAGFSQWAPFSVDIAAPGELVRTTAIDNGYAVASGTSFSSPHIAGVAALIKAETSAIDYRQLKAHLLYGGVNGVSTLGPVVPGQDKRDVPGRVSSGRIDANKALDGPPGGVLLVRGVSVVDSAGGNGNGVLDPGETAKLRITLENVWTGEAAVTGSLSTPDTGLLSVNDVAPVLFGTIGQDSSATADFSVTLSNSLSGNEQIFLQLDLASAGNPALPSRYFYFEAGVLENGSTVSQPIQRWDWDEFHGYVFNVPVGATGLSFATAGSGDLDLLVRHQQTPEYLISLGGGIFYYVDDDTWVSSGPGAAESVEIANPLPGVYHIVVVNFDQDDKTYDLTASYDPPTAGTITFAAATFSATENAGSATITVNRSGGLGAASVEYRTRDGLATAGVDYSATTGILSWGIGENGSKSFSVMLQDDQQIEETETVLLSLDNASGSALGVPATATLEIADDDNPGGLVAFSASQYTVNEAAGDVEILVIRTGDSAGAVSVELSTLAGSATGGTDYLDSSMSLNWDDGQSGTRTAMIPIIADTLPENPETFSVLLSNTQGAGTGTPASATVIINDDDTAPASSGGGGGAVGAPLLLILILVRIRRRSARWKVPLQIAIAPSQDRRQRSLSVRCVRKSRRKKSPARRG